MERCRPIAALLVLVAAGPGCGNEPAAAPSCLAPAPVQGRTPYHECAATGVCPRQRVRNDPQRPAWRVTYLRPTAPAGIANAAVEEAIATRMRAGTFLWALSFDLAGGTFRTGGLNPATRTLGATGLGLLDGQFRFFARDAAGMGDPARYDPVGGSLNVTGDRATTAAVPGTLRLPVFNADGSTFTVLPVTGLRVVGVRLSADRGCIGEGRPHEGRFDEHASVWNTVDDAGMPYGSMEADIAVAEAREVSVSLAGTVVPLCDLLAGTPCAMPMDQWRKAPDAMVNGTPAWHLRADFAAVAVTLRP